MIACAACCALQAAPSFSAAARHVAQRAGKTFVPPPILMYHRVDRSSPGDQTSRDLTVTPAQLEAQLLYLKAHGIAAISMADLEDRLAHRRPLDHAVILTFDDGYADQYWYAVPLLRKFHDDATFYVITGELGKARHFTWRQLHSMARDHLDIAAHGVRHDDLSLMSRQQQRYQIVQSISTLRNALHAPVDSYAYPSGRFNLATLAIVRAEGIPLAVTTDATNVIPPPNAFELPRIRVRGHWTLHDFLKALRNAAAARHSVAR
ncbi:MAG: polysaccharide deacetylase family protein [Candidatus Eremiobacteraeota bacterium]|nr:polysaccharide deacetylase family protein [Candidatus Eremiobacteraeota bacterium]